MKKSVRFALVAMAVACAFGASAQVYNPFTYAVKARAGFGLANGMNTNSSIPGMSGSTRSNDFGLDLGWTFWKSGLNSLEMNIGFGYSPTSTKLKIKNLNYTYSGDVEGIYNISYENQNVSLGRVTVPVYMSYGLGLHSIIGVHADAGFIFGFRTGTSIAETGGNGSFTQGASKTSFDLADAALMQPQAHAFSASAMVGIGAQMKIFGPLDLDVTFRYEAGMTNLYKGGLEGSNGFAAADAPVKYLSDGTHEVRALTDYLSSSRLSQFSVNISLICRF